MLSSDSESPCPPVGECRRGMVRERGRGRGGRRGGVVELGELACDCV